MYTANALLIFTSTLQTFTNRITILDVFNKFAQFERIPLNEDLHAPLIEH